MLLQTKLEQVRMYFIEWSTGDGNTAHNMGIRIN